MFSYAVAVRLIWDNWKVFEVMICDVAVNIAETVFRNVCLLCLHCFCIASRVCSQLLLVAVVMLSTHQIYECNTESRFDREYTIVKIMITREFNRTIKASKPEGKKL